MEDHLDKTDEELLGQYRLNGNSLFLNLLFLRYVDVGFRTAMRYMRNQTDAEDVLQLSLIQFLKNMKRFRGGTSTIKPWLMKIIVNTSLCKLREEKRRSRRQQVVASEKFNRHEQERVSSSMSLEQDELKEKIKDALDTLPEKYRSPIWLVLYEGFSYSEVSIVLAVPETTVRTQVARGLKRLKAILEPIGLMLSLTMIINLISESKLEAASEVIKHNLYSANLHQTLIPKQLNRVSHSKRIKVTPSSSFFFSPPVLIIACAVLMIGIYGFRQRLLVPADQSFETVNQNTKIEKNSGSNSFSKTWNFAKEADRKIDILIGNWEYSEKHKGMIHPLNKPILLSIPTIITKKCIIVEAILLSRATRELPNLSLNFSGFWSKDQKVLEYNSYECPKYTFDAYKPDTIIIYFYQNYICSFTGNQLIGVKKYSENLTDANIVLYLKNYTIQKLSVNTLTVLPSQAKEAIIKIANEKSFVQKSWFTNKPIIFE